MHELNSGDTRVLIDDQRGGAIVEYHTALPGRAIDWLVPAVAARPSCCPMVPYASRIRDGRFSFAERAAELRPNNPPEPHAIHGHGWQHTWVPSESQIAGSPVGSSLSLEYLHEADDWLWRYRAIQRFELEERRLRITLAVVASEPATAAEQSPERTRKAAKSRGSRRRFRASSSVMPLALRSS